MLIRTGLVVVSIILASLICYNCSAVEDLSYSDIVYVGGSGPGNYSSIQEAINDVTIGGTVFVYNGTYYENIIINKNINLVGEDRDITVIDGCGLNKAVKICADNVCVSGFTVQNTTRYKHIWMSSGIEIYQSDFVSIQNNIFLNNYNGVSIINSTGNVFRDNIMFNCSISLYGYSFSYYIQDIDTSNIVNEKPIYYYRDCNGLTPPSDAGELILVNCSSFNISNLEISNVSISIQLCYSHNNIIENNSCFNNAEGIFLFQSDYNIIKNNTCCCNDWDGIFLYFSDYNTVQNNNCSNNLAGIVLYNSKNNKIMRNNVKNNDPLSFHIDNSNKNEIICNNIIDSPDGGHTLLHHRSFFNKWDRNYWNKWVGLKFKLFRVVPKIIIGFIEIIEKPYRPIPYFDFDWHPADEPYLI